MMIDVMLRIFWIFHGPDEIPTHDCLGCVPNIQSIDAALTLDAIDVSPTGDCKVSYTPYLAHLGLIPSSL